MIDINIKTQITIINELVQTISYIKKNKHSRIQMCCMSCNKSLKLPQRLSFLSFVVRMFQVRNVFSDCCNTFKKAFVIWGNLCLRSLTSEIHWPHFPDLG